MLAGSFSFDLPALKSRWGTLNLDGGTLANANASPYILVLLTELNLE